MSRPKADPLDRALDAYDALSADEKAIFGHVVKRLGVGTTKERQKRSRSQTRGKETDPKGGEPDNPQV